MVEYTTKGLDLSALQYFQIRCYNKGKKVCEGVITESNTVSVGLAGSNQVQKVRFSAIFDAYNDDGTPIQFDEITLWKTGVLDLKLSVMRIYYAFVQEDYNPDTDVDNPLGCVTETDYVSTNNTNASINGNGSQMADAVAVGGIIDNLSYFIDDDLETPMKVVNTVGVGSGGIIAVNMGRTLDFRHQLCIVVDDKTYLAGVKVGNWLKVTTYMNGEPTGDEFKEWNVLGVNAIGYGDKRIMMMQPKSNYDEVRLEIAEIAGVLDSQNFFGMFLRGDIDNDGIPDCTDPESCKTNIEGIEATEVCKGDFITIKGKGLSSTDYYIQLPDQGINENSRRTRMAISKIVQAEQARTLHHDIPRRQRHQSGQRHIRGTSAGDHMAQGRGQYRLERMEQLDGRFALLLHRRRNTARGAALPRA